MNPLTPFFERYGFAMLDGGLSTELEALGANLTGELWTSQVLIDAPGLIRQAHTNFMAGGADVVASTNYQATVEGFTRAGLSEPEAEELMRRSVRIAIEARDAFWAVETHRAGRLRPLVAASLGPYGACLHDGSEYHGNYDIGKAELMDFHRPRIELLRDAGADLFAFETFPSLEEAEAIVELLNEFPEITAWISFSCQDDQHVAHGETFSACAELAAACPQLLAAGVNCTSPENIPALLRSARHAGIPLAAYPNSGEHWDAAAQRWAGDVCDHMDVCLWRSLGARLIGGCCRTASDDIRRMRAQLEQAA